MIFGSIGAYAAIVVATVVPPHVAPAAAKLTPAMSAVAPVVAGTSTAAPSASSSPLATLPKVPPSVPPAPAAPTASATPQIPIRAAIAAMPLPEHQPYVGADGAMHYPVDAHGQPQLTCMPLFVCDISLEAGENVLNVAAGDSARWLIASAQSGPGGSTPHVLVKPTAPDLWTNLIVTTTRRVYYIGLTAARTTRYSRLAFFYPEDEAAAAAAERAKADQAREAARLANDPLQPNGPIDNAFRQWGDSALLPARVYADATHTFIEFAQLPQDLPVLYAVTPDGNDQIVNYRVKGTVFIVDGAQRDFDLVLDAGTGRHGSGERRAHIRHR